MRHTLDGRVALISGSTKNIGRTIAKEFAHQGADVVVNGRSEAPGAELVEEIERETSSTAYFARGDINDPDEVERLVADAADEMGGIDVLVANGAAGSAPDANFFREMAYEDFLEFCSTHYASRMYLIKAALEHLIEADGGRVLNLTTDAGRMPTPAGVGQGGPAAALMLATRVLAKEFTRWDITVNTIAVTVTQDTERLERILEESPISSIFEKAVERQDFPLTSRDIAEVAAFLAGAEAARPITGQTISMTGGL